MGEKKALDIPILELKSLSERFGKDQIVIISWDRETKEVKGSAFGTDAAQMRRAERGLDYIFSALRKSPNKGK